MPERAPHNFTVQYAPFVAVLTVTVMGALFPGTDAWGFNSWAELPLWMLGLAVLVVLLGGALPIPKRAYLFVTEENLTDSGIASHSVYRWVAFTAIAAVLLALLIILRSRTALYGDGYLVVWLTTLPGTHSFFNTESQFRTLNALLYRGGYLLFSEYLHANQETAYGVTSAIGGLVGLIGLYKLAGELTKSRIGTLIVFLCGLASGCTILFFGYLEAYTWCTAVLLWHLFFSVKYVARKTSFATVIFSGIIMGLLNIVLFAVLAANLVLLLSRRHVRNAPDRYIFGLTFGRVLVTGAVAACIIVVAVRLLLPDKVGFILSPLPTDSYSLLAPHHLLDLVNEIFMVVPLLPAWIVLVLFTRTNGKRTSSTADHVMITTAAVTFLFSLWIDPNLGAARDWDLLSLFGFPTSILVGLGIWRRLPNPLVSVQWAVRMLLIVAVLLAPSVYEKMSKPRAAERLNSILEEDPHYQKDYMEAWIAFHWGTLLYQDAGRGDLAKPYFVRRVTAKPDDHRAWYNLGVIYWQDSTLDSAEYALRKAYQLQSSENTYRVGLVSVLRNLGREAEANSLMAEAQAPVVQNADEASRLGLILGQAGRSREALTYFRLADSLRPNGLKEQYNLGLLYLKLNEPESSLVYFRQALSVSDAGSKCDIYYGLTVGSIQARRADDAAMYFKRYVAECSSPSVVADLRARINRLKASSGQVK